MNAQLTLFDVHFAYDRDDVIRGVSLDIFPGDIVGVIGPNGAGKSTLIKLMAGALNPRSGRVFLSGAPLSQIASRERARKIAFVPQETHIPFSFTSMEIVLMGRAPYLSPFGFETKHDVEIARDAMERTDTFKFASRDIGELSGGERQRVILARALAQQTPLLLLDEPTTFLDIRHQADLHRLLARQNKDEGVTIISAMHDLNLAASFCNRIIILKGGRIAADGAPRDVITADAIGRAFDTEVRIGIDAHTGRPYYVPTVTGENP